MGEAEKPVYRPGDKVRITQYEGAYPVGAIVTLKVVEQHHETGWYEGEVEGDLLTGGSTGLDTKDLWFASYECIELVEAGPALVEQLANDLRELDNHEIGSGALAELLIERGWHK